MFTRSLRQISSQQRASNVCLFCAFRPLTVASQVRLLSSTPSFQEDGKPRKRAKASLTSHEKRKRRLLRELHSKDAKKKDGSKESGRQEKPATTGQLATDDEPAAQRSPDATSPKNRVTSSKKAQPPAKAKSSDKKSPKKKGDSNSKGKHDELPLTMSLKEALMRGKKGKDQNLDIQTLSPADLDFTPVDHKIPPVPMLSYGLDRVLFNPGVYRLQDPRSRVYNFDPYLEKILPVADFNFDALTEYKTSSKDEELLAITKRLGTKFTGSTSSMSSMLQHFHFVLSNWRPLNHDMLSRKYPAATTRFSKITMGPSAIFLRHKDGQYAIDADKSYDSPNIMSWMGHSLEKLLTSSRDEFERFRRSTPEKAPEEDESARCYHYSQLGNFLMRSQLDAHDPRLPGSGIFDLKTRAVVSIRMDHEAYEEGSGYQLRFDQGEWESYEREFYDMTRATMLKYSLQVRMGRMDGIFVAYHNVERMFGFQYLSLSDMDEVLHGQTDTCLGDQEFRLSLALLEQLLERATQKFPNTSIRIHFEAVESSVPYLYCFAEPVTEEQADLIQNAKDDLRREFERDVIGVNRDDPEMQAEWQELQGRVDAKVVGDAAEAENEIDEEDGAERAEPTEDAEVMEGAEREEIDEETQQAQETKENEEAEEGESAESPEPSENEESQNHSKTAPTELPADNPFVGWTLTVRSRVNGAYVKRPNRVTRDDDWDIEYHIKEIEEPHASMVFNKLKERRHKLVGQNKEDQSTSLEMYRKFIHKFSKSGRQWREQQDKIDEQMGIRQYRPMGPDAGEVIRQQSEQREMLKPEDATKEKEVAQQQDGVVVAGEQKSV